MDTIAADVQGEHLNNEYTAKASGTYLYVLNVIWSAPPTGDVLSKLYKNGASWATNTISNNNKVINYTRIIELTEGEKLSFYLQQNNGGAALNLTQANVQLIKLL